MSIANKMGFNTCNRLIKRFSPKESIVKNEGHTKFAHVRGHRLYHYLLVY